MADTNEVELGEKREDETGAETGAETGTETGVDIAASEPDDNGDEHDDNDDDHGDHDEHDGHAHATVEDTEPYKLHTMMDERPLTWCCVFCWLYLLNFIILIPIIVAVGQDAIYLTTDVPMYMRNHQSRKRQDALEAAWDEADFELASEISTTPQETPANVQLNLVFISKRSEGLNIEEALRDMNEVVEEVVTSKGYDEHCQLLYKNENDTNPICARPNRISDFFDPTYFKGSVDNSYDVEPTTDNYDDFVVPSKLFDAFANITNEDIDFSSDNIDTVTKYWAEYGEGTLNGSEEYGRGIYNGRQMQARFYFINPAGEEQELSNVFENLADQEFGETPDDTKINAAIAIVRFGYPLEGYNSDSDKTDDQDEDISRWAYENLHNYLWNYKSKYFTLRWGVGNMSNYYLEELIVQDMSLLIVTILCVWLYTVYTLKSFFLGCGGMIMIFMNFAPALLLYRYISQVKYFGTLNMLSIFIILSIGADDIFVLCDTWEQTRADSPNASRPKRLTFTLNHAAKVMFTTSISTIFSFLGNTSSEFPAVYTFGGFAAWLVWVNYCGVVLFFPNLLTLHEEYFWTPTAKYPWCIPKWCIDNQSPECCLTNLNANKEEVLRKSQLSKDDAEERRPIDLFFENTLHTFIYRWRLAVIAAFTVFFCIFLGFAAQLVPDPDPPQFFPDGNNYYEYNYALLDYFGAADNLRITNVLAMGIDGINRRGTDEAISEDIGKPKWDDLYNVSDPAAQLFVAQLCDDLLCGFNDYDCRYSSLWRNLKIEEPRTSNGLDVVRCWMTELREWFINDPDATLDTDEQEALIEDNNITFVTAEQLAECTYGEFPMSPNYCYTVLVGYVWVTDDLPTSNPEYRAGASNYDYWKDTFGVESTRDDGDRSGAILRFNTIEVKLDAYTTTEYRDGMRLYDRWNDYIDGWLDGVNGDVSQDQYGQEFETDSSGVSSLFFTDEGGVWTYFFVQAQIIYESLTGIALSLSLAFIVLVAATGNWIIAIMAIATITQLVILIMGFTVMQGYKLGVMEAIIFVMVVGMVVDYVVHCSEAYLHAKAQDRVGRSKGMLGLVGMSVVSGSFSTVVGVCWMLLATIGFFFKFGTSILFQEATSLAYALIYYTALLSVAGPQNKDGDVIRDYNRVKTWCQWRYSMWCGDGSVPEPEWHIDDGPSNSATTPKMSKDSDNQGTRASNKNEGVWDSGE